MINIAICDDDINVTKEIEDLINNMSNKQMFNIEIFVDGNEFLQTDYAKYDIVFLDIEMGSVSGIDIALEIRKINDSSIIFFITNHFRYISEALKSMPFQYILKPINVKRELFFEEFNRGLEKLKKSKHSIVISTQLGEQTIKADTIQYIEYINKKIIFHTNIGVFETVGKLKEWVEKLISYDFIQCHKSFIVNLNYIESVKLSMIIISGNTEIPIGRKYSQNFIEIRNKFLLRIKI